MKQVILVIALGVGVHAAHAQTPSGSARQQLVPFRDSGLERWGYRQVDGRVAIPPRYIGAGLFRDGRAPVKDDEGFAMIDGAGRILHRFVTDSVLASALPVPAPDDACAWRAATTFPSAGLRCYVRQLRRSAPGMGGRITISPGRGEGLRVASVLQLPNGVVVVEDVAYEGLIRRVLLPGVSQDEALQWRLKLYPELPAKDGCSEAWSVGVVPGGVFIEQRGGC